MMNRYPARSHRRRRAQLASLYRRAFPPQERVPLPLLHTATLRRGVDLEVYEDHGVFVAFTCTVQTPEVFFLLFLAVEEVRRGRGHGSQVLGDVLERAGRRPVVLEIEPLDPSAGNIDQRYRRLAFYQRHGLRLTGYDVMEGGERYTVLSSVLPLDVPALGRALRRLAPRPLRLPGLEPTRFRPEQEGWPQAARPVARPAGSVSAPVSAGAVGAGATSGSAGAVGLAGGVKVPRP